MRNSIVLLKLFGIIFLLSYGANCAPCKTVTFKIHVNADVIEDKVQTCNLDELDEHFHQKVRAIFADTLIVFTEGNTEAISYIIARPESDSSPGLLYLTKTGDMYAVVGRFIDPWSPGQEVWAVDFDRKGFPEIVSVWSDEDMFYVKVDQWDLGGDSKWRILEIYRTTGLGNANLWDGKHIEVSNDHVEIFFQNHGKHWKSELVYDRNSEQISLSPPVMCSDNGDCPE